MKDTHICANCGKHLDRSMHDENGFNFCSNKCYYTFYFDDYNNGNFPIYKPLVRGDFVFQRLKVREYDRDRGEDVIKLTEHWANCPNEGAPSYRASIIDESATKDYYEEKERLSRLAAIQEAAAKEPRVIEKIVYQTPQIVIADTSRNQDFYVGSGDGHPYSIHVDADHGLRSIGHSRY